MNGMPREFVYLYCTSCGAEYHPGDGVDDQYGRETCPNGCDAVHTRRI